VLVAQWTITDVANKNETLFHPILLLFSALYLQIKYIKRCSMKSSTVYNGLVISPVHFFVVKMGATLSE